MTKEEKNARRRELYAERKDSALRKKCTALIVKVLEDNGYHIENLNECDGYFIFDFGGNSVNTFHLKEIPKWKFGLWWTILDEEDGRYISAELFTQFEKDIDKFKPSRSTFLETMRFKLNKSGCDLYEYDGYDPFEDFYEYSIKPMLDFIKRHPYRAWARSMTWDYEKYRIPWTGLKCWYKYVDNLVYHKKKDWFQDWADRKLLRFFKKEVLCFFNNAGIYEYENISPKYDMYAPLSENKEMFNRRGLYGVFLTEREIEEFKKCDSERLRMWAKMSPKLKKKFDDKKKKFERISRIIGVGYYFPEIDDTITIVNKKAYDEIKSGDSEIKDVML